MPDDKTFDPFHPPQPSIPGVKPGEAKTKLSPPAPAVYSSGGSEEKAPPNPMLWVALTVLGGLLVLCGGFFYWLRNSPAEGSAAASLAALVSPVVPSAAKAKPAESLPAGPGPIATAAELSKAWSSKRFLFRDSVTAQLGPAMVVRLPGGEYWGFSLREPFGDCQLELVTDLRKLKSAYNFRADHPMVADPCNRTVYDLLQYGGGAGDSGLVRGEIVQGTGIRPPMAIEIQVKGKDIIATRME